MTVIAMTREMGSLGKEVARQTAAMLGLTVIHHEMIENPEEREAIEGPSEVTRFLEATPEQNREWNEGIVHGGYLSPAEILEIANRGNVLIRGWGAARLLRSVPSVLTVRVCAPMENRVAEMQRRLGVDEEAARLEIERSDAAHTRRFLAFFESDWRSPLNYDMTLNTGHLSIDCCAEILRDAVTSPTLSESEQTRRVLQDRLIEARIAEQLRGSGPLNRRATHVQSTVDGGVVRLYGAVTDGGAVREIERLVQDLPGVEEIRNEISRIGRYLDG